MGGTGVKPVGKLAFLAVSLAAPVLAEDPPAPSVDQTAAPYASTADSVTLPDGRRIHFVCMGEGSPTVILTAGLGDWAVSWSSVQPEIAATTRTCAWDRPGFGLSDAGAQAYSAATTTADLEAALAQGGIPGPYVLVGHSMGGFESLLYADRHPDQVAGMVLVDPTVPDQNGMIRRVAPALAAESEAFTAMLVGLVRTCAAQLREGRGTPAPECELPFPPTYPPALLQALRAEAAKPMQGEAVASFYENVALSGEQVVNPLRNYADMPLVVLTASEAEPPRPGTSPEAVEQTARYLEAFSREHDALAALSTRGINARVPGVTHYIHQLKPQVVVDAVEAVVAEARAADK
jgi:pimeloyl-ACP methyl ester carboxylesterase